MHSRFIIFRIVDYYPAGGMSDAEASYDSLEEVAAYLQSVIDDNLGRLGCTYQVFDCCNRLLIFDSSLLDCKECISHFHPHGKVKCVYQEGAPDEQAIQIMCLEHSQFLS